MSRLLSRSPFCATLHSKPSFAADSVFGCARSGAAAVGTMAIRALFACGIGIAAPVAASAQAPSTSPAGFQTMPVRYANPPAANYGGGYGGGFLEFLATGGSRSVGGPVANGPAYAQMEPDEDARRAAADPRYQRQVVDYEGAEKPGTVIINTPERLLYLVEAGGKALRYGIGVGRPGFTWAGVKSVSMKREWPEWRPPEEMLKRRPDLPHYMVGGPENPLGARALYLGSTLYRIHGSNEPWTIGTQVSSGCIRMRNEDVIDLYDRVPVGAKVMVI
jgi:lipoprotein-anchoring transpeptidase ErfK/SrfK